MKPGLACLTFVAALCASESAQAQTSAAPQQIPAAISTAGTQSPLNGGLPFGSPTAGILPLSIRDAVGSGLRHNLGVALSRQNVRSAESLRLRSLGSLLPHITVQTSEAVHQVNLAAVGFSGFPGVHPIVGPFSVFDVRALYSQSLLNLSEIDEVHAGTENLKAAAQSDKNTRDLVVLICLQLYMQAVAANSRIEAAHTQLRTAETLYELAQNRKTAGFAAGIEVLRAQVQLQAQQQRLMVADNEFAKSKLSLAQAIGLPIGQEFQLTDSIPYEPLDALGLEDAVQEGLRSRGDYQSQLSRVKAAELSRRAASRQRMPSLDLSANYGDIGQRPTSSHGSFGVAVSLRIPVFQGREIEARILEADAQLEQQKAFLESLRARIHYEIRTAFLDLKSAEDRVRVARSSLDLANEQVVQAQDRFAAGVASNIEVVQAQDALAVADENYISSVYAHNLAKAALAGAMGVAEIGYEGFLQGRR